MTYRWTRASCFQVAPFRCSTSHMGKQEAGDRFRQAWKTRSKIILRFFAGVAILGFASLGWAQGGADVAYIEQVRVKADKEEQFEITLKRHWGWHTKQGEKWTYFVWTVDTGKNEGAYQIASFGHTWHDVDESNTLVAGTPEPGEDTGPYHQSVQESYYRYRSDLSIAPPPLKPLAVASVTLVLVKPESIHDFEVAQRRVKEAFQKTKSTPNVGCWYELMIGGDRPQFLLIEQRPNLASLQEKGELDALMEETFVKQVGEDAVKSLWGSIRSVYTETWHYRPDLSRLIDLE
ncbi:MAG: hypothetical protein LAO03_21875 [Acidobacteriia bacterium]|nr:hypothetical protein [Terriglobia bacterium]